MILKLIGLGILLVGIASCALEFKRRRRLWFVGEASNRLGKLREERELALRELKDIESSLEEHPDDQSYKSLQSAALERAREKTRALESYQAQAQSLKAQIEGKLK